LIFSHVERICEILEKPILNDGTKKELDLHQSNLLRVKLDLINLLWTERDAPPASFTKNVPVLDGLCELLDIQVASTES
jgi:hypothetical protein